jgi:hypothetical protein
MSRELLNQLIEKVREIPTRPGNIGGQNYKYVRLEEVIGLLLDALDSYEAKPLPEPLGYVHHEMFAGFVKEPGDASMSCVKLHSPDSGYTVPVYAEPIVGKREENYSDALRSLASYVGCGGYNADDPIDAKEFEEKIRFGIDLLLSAQSQPCARKPFTDFL